MPQAHSHNDYNREIPLQSALENGFTSVEADILYIYGELFVGHNMPDSANHKLPTLTAAYLKPLYEEYKKNGKAVYPGYKGDFYLWIDIKFEAWKAYRQLKAELLPYKEMLTHWEKGKKKKGKVTIILSGDRPINAVQYDKNRMVTLDGRLSDLDKNFSPDLMPFISQNRRDIFQLGGGGVIPPEEYEKLLAFIDTCNEKGYKTRLWAIPEQEALWKQLLEAGIDLINTDHLERLKAFFESTE